MKIALQNRGAVFIDSLFITVKKSKNKVIIDSSKVHKYEIPENLMREMRSSVILAGAIIGRHHQAIFSYQGDCDIWWIHRASSR